MVDRHNIVATNVESAPYSQVSGPSGLRGAAAGMRMLLAAGGAACLSLRCKISFGPTACGSKQ